MSSAPPEPPFSAGKKVTGLICLKHHIFDMIQFTSTCTIVKTTSKYRNKQMLNNYLHIITTQNEIGGPRWQSPTEATRKPGCMQPQEMGSRVTRSNSSASDLVRAGNGGLKARCALVRALKASKTHNTFWGESGARKKTNAYRLRQASSTAA